MKTPRSAEAFLLSTRQPLRLLIWASWVSFLVGVMIAMLSALSIFGELTLRDWPGLVAGGLIGVFTFGGAIAVDLLVFGLLSPQRWARLARFLSLGIGGTVGYSLGTLAVSALGLVVFESASLSLQRLVFFGVVALLVGSSIELVERQRTNLEASIEKLKEREFAEKELEVARSLQRRLLPPDRLEGDGWTVHARHVAARGVAGDLWDTFGSGEGGQVIAVGDVAGKGMPASLIMASVKATLPFLAGDTGVGESLREMNRRLARDLLGREFVALALARFDVGEQLLEVANAGSPDPWLLRADGSVEVVEVSGARLPLGLRADVEYAATSRALAAGDRLVLMSDGLPEAVDERGEVLGYERVEALLKETLGVSQKSAEAGLGDLMRRVAELGCPVEDDWTIVVVDVGEAV